MQDAQEEILAELIPQLIHPRTLKFIVVPECQCSVYSEPPQWILADRQSVDLLVKICRIKFGPVLSIHVNAAELLSDPIHHAVLEAGRREHVAEKPQVNELAILVVSTNFCLALVIAVAAVPMDLLF